VHVSSFSKKCFFSFSPCLNFCMSFHRLFSASLLWPNSHFLAFHVFLCPACSVLWSVSSKRAVGCWSGGRVSLQGGAEGPVDGAGGVPPGARLLGGRAGSTLRQPALASAALRVAGCLPVPVSWYLWGLSQGWEGWRWRWVGRRGCSEA